MLDYHVVYLFVAVLGLVHNPLWYSLLLLDIGTFCLFLFFFFFRSPPPPPHTHTQSSVTKHYKTS